MNNFLSKRVSVLTMYIMSILCMLIMNLVESDSIFVQLIWLIFVSFVVYSSARLLLVWLKILAGRDPSIDDSKVIFLSWISGLLVSMPLTIGRPSTLDAFLIVILGYLLIDFLTFTVFKAP